MPAGGVLSAGSARRRFENLRTMADRVDSRIENLLMPKTEPRHGWLSRAIFRCARAEGIPRADIEPMGPPLLVRYGGAKCRA